MDDAERKSKVEAAKKRLQKYRLSSSLGAPGEGGADNGGADVATALPLPTAGVADAAEVQRLQGLLGEHEKKHATLLHKLQSQQQSINVLALEKVEAATRAERLERENRRLTDVVATQQEQLALAAATAAATAPTTPSPEQQLLRTERDALARRVAELEQTQARSNDGAALARLREEVAAQVQARSNGADDERLKQFQEHNRQLEQLLHARDRDVQHAEAEIAALKGQLHGLEQTLAQDKARYHQLLDEETRLQHAHEAAEAARAAATAELQAARAEMARLQHELAAVTAAAAAAAAAAAPEAGTPRADDRDALIAQLRTEVERLSEDSRERARLNNRLRESSEQTERLMVDNRKLFEQLNELRDRFVQITNEKMELADQVVNEQGRIKRLRAEIEAQRAELATARVNGAQHGSAEASPVQVASALPSDQAEQLREQIRRLEAERKELRLKLEEEQYMTERLRMEIETIPDYISMYHKERSALKAKFLEQERLLGDLTLVHQKTIKQLVQARETLENVSWENKRLRRLAEIDELELNGPSANAIMLSDTLPIAATADYVIEELKKEPRAPVPVTALGPVPSMGKRGLAFPPCAHCVGISFFV